ncbi:hypothetical protein [Salmonirosea aquatica]|uniref:Uncharacterized protein n=1 Tax=Salmonirosea aquatica TaxID=2654236 RepID=A0A7C9BHZ3_9BACT|nr:hypothetical protein [Cytophagaceae bacterium SJW1-29]
MNEKPSFVSEVMEWAQTLPVEEISLSESFSNQWALHILSKNETDLRVNLLPLVEEKKTLSSSAETEGKPTLQVTLWEDIWHTKRSIVQSRIKAQLGISERIPARLTQARRLDRPTTLDFLQENHLQDAVLSKFKYGLFLPSKHFRVLQNPPEADALLVAVGTFARPRQFVRAGHPHYSFELVRYANLLNTTVVGGLDKLLSHFTKAHQPDDVMTYADLEWSTGRSYLKLGFVPTGDTPPQRFWINPQTMERYYPHRLPDGLSEQTASERGYIPLFNAGSRKFVKVMKVPHL